MIQCHQSSLRYDKDFEYNDGDGGDDDDDHSDHWCSTKSYIQKVDLPGFQKLQIFLDFLQINYLLFDIST